MSLSKNSLKSFNTVLVLVTILATILESTPAISYPFGNCRRKEYMCKNEDIAEQCIPKSMHCDGSHDCYDGSDEEYCYISGSNNQRCNHYEQCYHDRCPSHYPFFKCGQKCIPEVWKCDGETDCPDGSDEINCPTGIDAVIGSSRSAEIATKWFKNQMTGNATNKWGIQVPRIAVALHTSNSRSFATNSIQKDSLKYEVSLRLTKILLKEQLLPGSVSPNVLASYLNALVVSCIDPTDFFGLSVVQMLRDIVDTQGENVNPFLLLALCNAGDRLSERDLNHLQQVFREKQQAWTSVRAVALMAVACAMGKDNSSRREVTYNVTQMASDLKKIQQANGSFENMQTTALVVQALMAAGEMYAKDWDHESAVEYLVKYQKEDGSFGSLLNTYYALSVLNTQNLANLNFTNCYNSSQRKDNSVDHTDLKLVENIHVKYSIALGNKVEFAFTMTLRVPLNISFFDMMQRAASLDNKFKFEHVIEQNGKPRVYELNGIQDDPEYGTYWFLFSIDGSGERVFLDLSPVDVIVQDKQEYMMWYRSTPSKNATNATLGYSTEVYETTVAPVLTSTIEEMDMFVDFLKD